MTKRQLEEIIRKEVRRNLKEANTSDKSAENLVKKIVKSNSRFKWIYDELPDNYSREDVKKILNNAGYGKEYDRHIKEMYLKEETAIDYRYIDSATAAVNDAHNIIQKFNDTVKTTSTHFNVQSIKEKMFKLEEFLDKYETQLDKIRNKF